MVTDEIDSMEFHDALRSVRVAKNCLLVVLGLVLAVQLMMFILVDWVGVIDTSAEVVAHRLPTADEPLAAGEQATFNYDLIKWFLAGSKFAGLVATVLLIGTFLLAVDLSLLGRIGGPAGFVGGFFWSLILLVFMIPWQTVLNTSVACGATFNLSELVTMGKTVKPSWGAKGAQFVDWVTFYARFMAYPIIGLLVVFVVAIRFARGYRPLKVRPVAAALAEMEPAQSHNV
jgi:hypothetical protein